MRGRRNLAKRPKVSKARGKKTKRVQPKQKSSTELYRIGLVHE